MFTVGEWNGYRISSQANKCMWKSVNSNTDILWVLGQRHVLRGNQTTSLTQLHPEEPQKQVPINKTIYLVKILLQKCCDTVGMVNVLWLYLTVCNGIKLLTDLFRQDDVVFSRRQRVRGGQSINCKHTVDVVKYYQVFLREQKKRKFCNFLFSPMSMEGFFLSKHFWNFLVKQRCRINSGTTLEFWMLLQFYSYRTHSRQIDFMT